MKDDSSGMGHYGRLAIMVGLHFVAMYALMYAMVDAPANVFHNVNQVYMAGLMTAAMLAIEIPLMGGMYPRKRLNLVLVGGGIVILLACFLFIRQQTGVSDRQFLRSMIPHHASAILMCEQAAIRDPAIEELCRSIVAAQQAEIDQMKALLERERTSGG